MGLFKKENCVICSYEVAAPERLRLNDGTYLCNYCQLKVNLSPGFNKNMLKASSVEAIKERMEYVERDRKENQERVSNFVPTFQVGGLMWFDDTHKWFVFPQGTIKHTIAGSYVYKYEEITDFEVNEDGATVTKGGLGKALVGGALFGVAGAIAGGTSKKSTAICNRMTITIMTTNVDTPVLHINLILGETPKGGLLYAQAVQSSQEISVKLNSIIEQLQQEKNRSVATPAFSAADEIKKFKELLDMGVLTQEEFDAKKKELLGL